MGQDPYQRASFVPHADARHMRDRGRGECGALIRIRKGARRGATPTRGTYQGQGETVGEGGARVCRSWAYGSGRLGGASSCKGVSHGRMGHETRWGHSGPTG